MTLSLHSHSGQFCLHAKGTLEQVVLKAIERGFKVYGLSEHIPRSRPQDLYPEEKHLEPSDLKTYFIDFLNEAERLKLKYSHEIELIIGLETEWIYSETKKDIQDLYKDPRLTFMIGSVHHVHEIPIDFDLETYNKALEYVGNDLDVLYQDYFDAQYSMLQSLKPTIVGHFDLIRLFSPSHPLTVSVWNKIQRNLSFIQEYGGIIEINSRSLKKGLLDPYPQRDILQSMLTMGLSFTLSDDSHGPNDVGMHYDRLYKYIKKHGITKLVFPKTRSELGWINVEDLGDVFWEDTRQADPLCKSQHLLLES